jgi:hypothetical protein
MTQFALRIWIFAFSKGFYTGMRRTEIEISKNGSA